MISKGLLLFFVFFLLCADAKRRGGGGSIRTGSSNESSSGPVGKIIGTIAFLFSCGCGIFWKFYKCFGKKQPRQQRMYYYVPANLEQTFRDDQLNQRNETDLSSEPSNTLQYILIHVSDESSENRIYKNELDQAQIHISNNSQQITNKQEECSVVVPMKNIETPPPTN